MRTDYLGLEAFVAIAELGSFSRAAAFLNLSQTALSHRIRKLEAELGFQLFIRSTRDVSLTKEAQEILPEMRRSLKHLSTAYSSLVDRGRARINSVSFACLPTLAYNYLPQVLRAFCEEFPDIVVKLEDRTVARIYEMVQSGEVEFGISIVGARHWDLDIREIYTEPYVLFVRRDHPLAARGSVTRADLAGLAFARINTQSSNRRLVDDALGAYRERILWRYQVQNAAMALSLVAEGAAVTILPSLMANLAWQELTALPFSDVEMKRTLGLVTRRGVSLSAPSQRLISLITQRLAER
jgi:DNA-binding transcriptional LysR family regulator